MIASAYLRHPATLLAAVSIAILFVWFALGYPVPMPPSPLAPGEKISCVSYAPVPQADQFEISVEQIETDLARLAPHAGCVRTYATGWGLDRVPEIARQHGMQVLQGIAIGRDAQENREEIARALELAQTQRSAIRAFVVGRRVVSRGELTTSELGTLIRTVRDSTKLPVTYAEDWARWFDMDGLATIVDFITIHIDLYTASYPVAPEDAARRVLEARSRLAARYSSRAIQIDEVGWPSAGRMREGAYPSPVHQARVLHDILAAAKSANVQVNIFEGIDQPRRQRGAGTAAGHWGLIDADTGALKFRWGAAVSNSPLWFTQAMIGLLLAFVVFAAAYLAARSEGKSALDDVGWRPVAIIALAAGSFIGWAVADMPLQNQTITDWAHAGSVLVLGFVVPPVAASSIVLRIPLEGLAAILDPARRRRLRPLARVVTLLFLLVVALAIQQALVVVFDSNADIPFAVLTGPAVAWLVLSFQQAPSGGRDGAAERVAACFLAAAAVWITISESVWNWQALWFAAILLALAWSCRRARGVQVQ
jgi:exo-beta-1,3-glucanase (GH17 family)